MLIMPRSQILYPGLVPFRQNAVDFLLRFGVSPWTGDNFGLKLDFRVLGQLDALERPKYAVLVNCMDGLHGLLLPRPLRPGHPIPPPITSSRSLITPSSHTPVPLAYQ